MTIFVEAPLSNMTYVSWPSLLKPHCHFSCQNRFLDNKLNFQKSVKVLWEHSTARKRSCGNVMFLHVCVILSGGGYDVTSCLVPYSFGGGGYGPGEGYCHGGGAEGLWYTRSPVLTSTAFLFKFSYWSTQQFSVSTWPSQVPSVLERWYLLTVKWKQKTAELINRII